MTPADRRQHTGSSSAVDPVRAECMHALRRTNMPRRETSALMRHIAAAEQRLGLPPRYGRLATPEGQELEQNARGPSLAMAEPAGNARPSPAPVRRCSRIAANCPPPPGQQHPMCRLQRRRAPPLRCTARYAGRTDRQQRRAGHAVSADARPAGRHHRTPSTWAATLPHARWGRCGSAAGSASRRAGSARDQLPNRE